VQAEPFRIHVEQSVLDDLQQRLRRARWASVLRETTSDLNWDFGTDPTYLRRLVEYWKTAYEWRQQEATLNSLAQFTARVEGAPLHFVHVTSRRSDAMPLLLLHGWPDSFYRFHKVIPLLNDPLSHDFSSGFRDAATESFDPTDTFDLVVPSLPGFIFTPPLQNAPRSQPLRHTARLLWTLMTKVLGYSRFAVAGGDGGSPIAQIIAIEHPESVIAIHLTDLGWHAANVDPALTSKTEQKYLAASQKQFMNDGAYAMVQSTRPRSLAAGFNDSPVGLASWIVDRFHSWSDGDIEVRFSEDELLTNIMLYWTTQCIGSSMFGYYAEARSPTLTPADHVAVPVGLALFPKDIGGIPPRSLAERTLNVQRWTEMPRGGHFAALEEPKLFARDVIDFFRAYRTSASDSDTDRYGERPLNSQVVPTLTEEAHRVR
jgi:pimeloyl-ACP methyl ester carboxylesterase